MSVFWNTPVFTVRFVLLLAVIALASLLFGFFVLGCHAPDRCTVSQTNKSWTELRQMVQGAGYETQAPEQNDDAE